MRNTKSKRSSRPSNNASNRSRPNRKGGGGPKGGGPKKDRRQRKQPRVSSINPMDLIKEARHVEEVKYQATTTYADMYIDDRLKKNIATKGFTHPTEIQDKAIPDLIDGNDLVGIANTGTGKTGAFLIPLIERQLRSEKRFQSLIVVPTRELALQVEEEFKSLAKGLGIFSACFIGGTNVDRDVQKLNRFHHFIIGTPGRLIDLMNQGALRLDRTPVLILDEFDKMLDMGFVRDIQRITQAMTNRRQTLLFSATIDKTQNKLIADMTNEPIHVQVSSGTTSSDRVHQDIVRVPEGSDKFKLLLELMTEQRCEKVILFTETKHLGNRICRKLNNSGIPADVIHGNKSQNYRVKALDKFKRGEVKVLVATDVAARGIDISDVTHVINYQLPYTMDSYIHRIGRTGRAGKTGHAFTFVDEK